MWGPTIQNAEMVVLEARATRQSAQEERARSRDVRADALVLMVHSLALRGFHGFSGGSAPAKQAIDGDGCPICPVCDQSIKAGASAGGTSERQLHLDCWLKEREAARQAPKRPISGGSDVDLALIASVLQGVALCGDCLARKTGIPRGKIEEGLSRIATTITLTTNVGRCDLCRDRRVVHRLG